MDIAAAIVQPIGHASQMPAEPRMVMDKAFASATRRIRSVKVEIINCLIRAEPRRTPSAASFDATTK